MKSHSHEDARVCRVASWDRVAGAEIGGEIMKTHLVSENVETKEVVDHNGSSSRM